MKKWIKIGIIACRSAEPGQDYLQKATKGSKNKLFMVKRRTANYLEMQSILPPVFKDTGKEKRD